MPQRLKIRFVIFRIITVCGLLAAILAGVEISPVSSVAASSGLQLQPGAGQFFPIAPVKILDTRSGTGGVPSAPIAANSSVVVPAAGVGDIPDVGVADIYAVITSLNSTQPGAIEDYNSDLDNPGIWTVPFAAGQPVSVSDMIQVSQSGDISVTNASPGTTDVVITVLGYTLDQNAQVAGDLYVGLPVNVILDTRTGNGAPQAQIPAGGSLTFQVTGKGGVPSEAVGAALYLGTANASSNGYVSAFPPGGTDPGLSIMSYGPARVVHNLYYGALSASGQLTLVNHGSVPVDLLAEVQGYLVGPTSSDLAGSYQDVPEDRIADTRSGTGGVSATPVPSGGSVTFPATGVDGVPATGVSAVIQTVAALNPTANGYLSAYAAGSADPNAPGVNFDSGDLGAALRRWRIADHRLHDHRAT